MGYTMTDSLAAALAQLQTKLPEIRKSETAKVETKTGSYSYTYADLASISAQVMPLLGELGLSFIARPTFAGDRFVLACSLLHVSGEREEAEYPLPTGGSPQAIGSAITYGRRYCLCAMTGVAPEDDDDGAAAEAEAARSRRADSQPSMALPKDLVDARELVKTTWEPLYGPFDQAKAAEAFYEWSMGGALTDAPAKQLRSFAAYLATPPQTDDGAGAHPAALSPAGEATATPAPSSPHPAAGADDPNMGASAGSQETPPAAGPRGMMTARQRGMLFALLNGLGVRDAAEQLYTINALLGAQLESRKDITGAQAKTLLDVLNQVSDRDDLEAAIRRVEGSES